MEAGTAKWLHISVFYQMDDWNKLFSDCIGPTLPGWKQKYLLNYFFQLNDERGENVRFSFLVKSAFCQSFLTDVAQMLNKFFDYNPSIRPDVELPIDAFLLEFPVNSVFYNLHQSSFSTLPNDVSSVIHELQSSLSDTILKEFQSEKFDRDFVRTLYIYIGFSFLSVYDEKFNDLEKVINIFLTRVSAQWSIKDLQIAQTLFREDKEELSEIAGECFSSKSSALELDWIQTWKLQCNQFFETLAGVISGENFSKIAMLSFEKITEQLNFSKKEGTVLQWLLLMNTKELIKSKKKRE